MKSDRDDSSVGNLHGATPGVISEHEIYTLEEFCKRTGLTPNEVYSLYDPDAYDVVFPVSRVRGKQFIVGSIWLNYVRETTIWLNYVRETTIDKHLSDWRKGFQQS